LYQFSWIIYQPQVLKYDIIKVKHNKSLLLCRLPDKWLHVLLCLTCIISYCNICDSTHNGDDHLKIICQPFQKLKMAHTHTRVQGLVISWIYLSLKRTENIRIWIFSIINLKQQKYILISDVTWMWLPLVNGTNIGELFFTDTGKYYNFPRSEIFAAAKRKIMPVT
jgi:hypothetical protein